LPRRQYGPEIASQAIFDRKLPPRQYGPEIASSAIWRDSGRWNGPDHVLAANWSIFHRRSLRRYYPENQVQGVFAQYA
jgi:hypothetical protein